MRRLIPVGLAALSIGACTSSAHRGAATTAATSTTVALSSAPPVWLCRPGQSPDPCESDLRSYAVSADGARTLQPSPPAAHSAYDCFYVYPTVSPEKRPNADLTVQPSEEFVARSQASRFSSVCRVWAPMYRQVTLSALVTGGLGALNVAYNSLLSDWNYYLRHDNGGRPVVLIGHSQGAAMLVRLIAEQIDPNPALRRRLVAAVLAGGNLQVPIGRAVGATFKHIPLCASTRKAGCVIAYSTFGSTPPAGALFGRAGAGVSLMSLQFQSAGQEVACVNPANVGGTGPLQPYFRDGGAVPWITYPGLYDASCRSVGGATWLQVDAARGAGDSRPVVRADLGPTWGFHIYDVNLALGNLVSDVGALESVYVP